MKLFGKNQVYERLKANPQSIKQIYLLKNSDLKSIADFARQNNIDCIYLEPGKFVELSGEKHSQGVIAEIEEFTYSDLDELLALPKEEKYTLIAISNINDPQNLGSILRSAACFGGLALVLPKHRSVQITETVLKVACGGENYVPVVQVTNLIPAIEKAKESGYWIVGGVTENGENLSNFKLPFPLCLVIGSEGEGIRKGILSHLDYQVTIPMRGKVLSLNTAVASAVFFYEISRQRQK